MLGEWGEWIWAMAISLGSVTLGTLARYAHAARRTGTKIDWKRFKYEGPTILVLTIIAVPTSEYLRTTLNVDQGISAATCVSLGYLGTRVFDLLSKLLEKSDEKGD